MRRYALYGIALLVLATSGESLAQRRAFEPSAAYAYPAGGRRGETVEVIVGGQALNGADGVHLTGGGVDAEVVRFLGPVFPRGQSTRLLVHELRTEWARRTDAPMPDAAPEDEFEGISLPEHALFQDLQDKNLRELAYLRSLLQNGPKRQQNLQMAAGVLIRVHIAFEAEPGLRELRVITPRGVSNPLRFEIGALPETREPELNDPAEDWQLPPLPAVEPPIVINGQVMPGDIDRIPFTAAAGDPLLIRVRARALIPYLPDAVPGWFQAVAAVYDSAGREVAFCDDFRQHPDPVLLFDPPEAGVYELEVRDAIYRGREDFVYRASIAPAPFITGIFPPGGPQGETVEAKLTGWNLHQDTLQLDTGHPPGTIARAALQRTRLRSNETPYAIGALPEVIETEPNGPSAPQSVELPVIVNGRIGRPGDADVFVFEGRAGQIVIAEVEGRKLGSPIDSFLRVTGPSGEVLAINDDAVAKEGHLFTGPGLVTHHADSYLRCELAETGTHRAEIQDIQQQGGEDVVYRLRISAPQPDFALRATPSSLGAEPGRHAVMRLYALRKDGFDGPIELALEDPPDGVTLQGGTLPAGADWVDVTIAAPGRPSPEPHLLRMTGSAFIAGEKVTHRAQPADDRMQAFLWRHLVPAQALVASVRGRPYRGREIKLLDAAPVRIPAGGEARLVIQMPRHPRLPDAIIEWAHAPEGLSIAATEVVSRGLALTLRHDGEGPAPGHRANLLPAMSIEEERQGAVRRIPLGYLPAVPYEIVAGPSS